MVGFLRYAKRGSRESIWTEAEIGNVQILGGMIRDWLLTHEEYRNHPDQSYTVELAVVEACTNIIRYAYDAPCRKKLGISMKRVGHEIEIVLLDNGVPFDPTRRPPPNLDEPQEGGYGVFLFRQIMREVCYQRRGSLWNVLRMKHDVPTWERDSTGTQG